ncbi:peptide chain release factor N(5)-glutamine methyltransferase [Candidatus Parcubacteria bacterium]|nr:peptide chain release factor N(5)-glutamine methyltransferase [Candidatus Parcubacteria bacterium]
MTVGQLLSRARSQLQAAGVPSARLDSQLLLEHVTGQGRSWLLAHPEVKLPGDQVKTYRVLTDRRSRRVPLVHLTSGREFYGMSFFVDANVLVPRVETEKLVELAVEYSPPDSSLIDIGTGCGAIVLAIAKQRPDLSVTATDVSVGALNVARRNAAKHNLRVELLHGDLFGALSTPQRFSTVVANLPYLPDDARDELLPEVKREPNVALFGGPGDGLGLYRRFLAQLPRYLAPGGYLFTESDPWQQAALIQEANKIGLKPIEQDYFILGFRLA